LSTRYPRNYLFKLQLADAMAWKIVAERTTKPAKRVISSNEEQDVFAIYDSLLREKALAPQTTLIQVRRNETARLLSGMAR
jgi:hypothetical protein